MNDRELLELAAKAFDLQLWENYAGAFQLFEGDPDNGQGKFVCFWNPLKDDGDALRLAVKLSLIVRTPCIDTAKIYQGNIFPTSGRPMVREIGDGDHCAATRRAIVRAAAAIGEAMP